MDTQQVIEQLAAANGGVVARGAAIKAGANPKEIEQLRRRGAIVVIRRGWYKLPGAQPLVVAAVRSGAVITCVSALKHHAGVWIPPSTTKTHLRRPRHRSTRKGAGCRASHPLPTPTQAVDPLPVALQCAANCLPADQFVAVLDSTLRMLIYSEADLHEIFKKAPQRVTRLLELLDPQAGSGTESIVRYRLHCKHITVRSQVTIPALGRVDLLVGDKLILECDSDGYHGGDQRRADNKRDRVATRGDYRVMRIDYTEVFADWDNVLAEILDIVRTDRHVGKTRVVNVDVSDDTKPDLAS